MKKIQFKIAAVACCLAMMFTSCTKDELQPTPQPAPGTQPVTITATTGTDTRLAFDDKLGESADAVMVTWKAGDKFTLLNEETKESNVFTLTSGAGSKTATFSGVLPAYEELSELIAYYPSANIDFTAQVQNGNASMDHLSNYTLLIGEVTDNGSDYSISFAYESSLLKFQLTLPDTFDGDGGEALLSLTLSTTAEEIFYYSYNYETGESSDGNSITMGLSNVTPEDNAVTIYMSVSAINWITTGETITIKLISNKQIYIFTKELEDDDIFYYSGQAYTGTVAANQWSISSGIFDNAVADLNLAAITESYGEGTGGSSDPYEISSARLLKKLILETRNGTNYAGKFFKLTTDIHVTVNTWTPLGNSTYKFFGNFDGNNHIITGELNGTSNDFGFFGHIYEPTANITIKNLTVKANVTAPDDKSQIGGIVGMITALNPSSALTKIENCQFDGTLTGGDYIGGILGRFQGYEDGTFVWIIDCTSKGTITANSETHSYIGGILGLSSPRGVRSEVKNCTNYANVSTTSTNTGIFGGVGGIAGAFKSSLLEGCTNYGKITGITSLGGIVGIAERTEGYQAIYRSNINYGEVGNAGAVNVGGIVGSDPSFGGDYLPSYVSNTNHSRKIYGDSYVGGIWGNINASYETPTGGNTNNNPSVPDRGVAAP